MKTTWLHVSDFHFRQGDTYDSAVVLKALVDSVNSFRENGRVPEFVFATGDIAYSGKNHEYVLATEFFDKLIGAAGVRRERLFVVPGNHDVDRDRALGLSRTLGSGDQANEYFGQDRPLRHIVDKQEEFLSWYNSYFEGIRSLDVISTCSTPEIFEVEEGTLGILPINSALFCLDDNDHAKLWIGRRCLQNAVAQLEGLNPDISVALLHHPIDWMADTERSNISSTLQANIDFVLSGHLHQSETSIVETQAGKVLYFAAGASYQTRQYPNRALYCSVEGHNVTVFPIRYEDSPQERWTLDTSLYSNDLSYQHTFSIPKQAPELSGRDHTSPAHGSGATSIDAARSDLDFNSLTVPEYVGRLRDEFQFTWEPSTFGNSTKPVIVYWPVRLREPKPIHAVQAFAAAGLERLGAKIILCLDDLGNTTGSAPNFSSWVRERGVRVGASSAFPETRLVSQLLEQDDSAKLHEEIDRWMVTTDYRLPLFLEVVKLLGKNDEAVSRESIDNKRPRSLLNPAVVWAALASIKESNSDHRVITLGGNDERDLWRAWGQRSDESANDTGHLYIPILAGVTTEKDRPQRLAESILAWRDSSDALEDLRASVVDPSSPWDDDRLPLWTLNGCILLPRAISGSTGSLELDGNVIESLAQVEQLAQSLGEEPILNWLAMQVIQWLF